ncbi:MAG: S8 family serine peptidase, partial [Gammaproteobacteria bacterium]
MSQNVSLFSPRTPPTADVLNGIDDAPGFAQRKRDFEKAAGYTKKKWADCPIFCDYKGTDNGLDLINAAAAYARGATGKGEIVGVMDKKIDHKHAVFVIQEDGTSKVTFGPDDDPNKGVTRHGTAVASLIAGLRPKDRKIEIPGRPKRKNGSFYHEMHGVAFDAAVVGRSRVGGISHPFITFPHNVDGLLNWDEPLDKAFAEWLSLDYARKAGAAIVNHSFGFHFCAHPWGADCPFTRLHPDEVRERLKHTAAEFAQKDIPDADKIIVVWAAGNNSESAPALTAGLGVDFPELQSHVLAVVAVEQDGIIADFSNRCGAAKNFCLAAPGDDLVAANWVGSQNGPFRSFGGTSAAAPMVSGSLAVMRQYFRRQLGNTELVSRLLATANRDGRYANSDIYGHGLVNLDAATAPVESLSTSLSGDPLARPFTGGGFAQSGGAFGGAMQDALAGVEIAAFDQLDAPFFFPATNGITHAPRASAAGSDNMREHEIALSGKGAQGASLSLLTEGNELAAARLRRGDWWFSYGHHGGREAGLYLSDGGGNAGGVGGIDNAGISGNTGNSENIAGGIGIGRTGNIGNISSSGSGNSGNISGSGAGNIANTGGIANAAANTALIGGVSARHFREPLAFASPYLSLVRDGPGFGWANHARGGARFG